MACSFISVNKVRNENTQYKLQNTKCKVENTKVFEAVKAYLPSLGRLQRPALHRSAEIVLRILTVVVHVLFHMMLIFLFLFTFSAWILHLFVAQTELNRMRDCVLIIIFQFVFNFVLVDIKQLYCTFATREDQYHHVVLESGKEMPWQKS